MDNTKIFFISVMILFVTSLSSSEAKKAIEERITPVGQVCIEGQNCSEVVAKTDYSITETRSGEEIYNGTCNTCHGIGLAGTPKFGDRVSWGERANEDLDKLVASVTNGLNGMPPMGMCMDCSEEELTGSVQYMLDAFN